MASRKPTTGNVEVKNFKAEDYSRFLIREFLKKNGFDKTYDSFIKEDTRPKVTMTKNELTRLLGIEALMKRNSKSKVFNTMMDILCDFLMISKDATNGGGVQYPKLTTSSIQITERRIESPTKNSKMDAKATSPIPSQSSKPRAIPISGNRPQTSVPGGTSKTQANFYNPGLSSKPTPLMNAFSAGSNAEISTQNIDMASGMLNKQSSKPTIAQNNGFMMGTDGKSTSAGTSKPAFDSSRGAGIVGSIQQ